MRRVVKKYFIPHEENEYKPHFLRGRSVFMFSLVVVLLFLWGIFYSAVITKTDFFAAIVPLVLVDLANGHRNDFEVPPLSVNPILEEAARLKALDMATKGYFAHTSPEGVTPWFWFSKVGYSFTYAGENLAILFTESEAVDRAWMASPGHRANVINSRFTEIGIAVSKGVYNGREAYFVAELFGRPSAKKAVVAEVEEIATIPNFEPAPVPSQVAAAKSESITSEAELIKEDDMFVAVKNSEEEISPVPQVMPLPPQTSHAAFWEYVLVSPSTLLRSLYTALGLLVLTSLLLMIFIEIKQQHPRHIFYGVFLLSFIAAAYYASEVLIFRGAMVI